MKRLTLLVVALQMVVLTSIASAQSQGTQSLGDVARHEEQRRKTIKKPAKVYTNKDLTGSDIAPPTTSSSGAFSSGQSSSESGAPAGDSAQSAPSEGTPSGDASAEAAAPPADNSPVTKEDWQKRLQDARSALERNQMFAEALQTRINSLTTDFVARDDPAQRAAIESERRKALAQLDKVKRDIEDQTKAIADIQEQARRAGVPAGWVR
jgi:hypothetical protein